VSNILTNTQVLVIGGSSGIGLATAVAAGEAGACVTIASRSKVKLDAPLASIRGNGRAVVLDTRDQSSLERFFTAEGPWMILPLWSKWLELHATTLIGHGNGRYGSAQLSDSTYNTRNGSMAALREQQGLVGLLAHPLESLDVYAYAGLEQQTAAYGIVPDNNLACKTNFVDVGSLPASAQCGGVGKVRQVAGDFVWKAYRGPLGYVTAGPELEYVKDTTYPAKNDTSAETHNIMAYFTIRYYP
jgi:hypothetical protein